MEFGSKISKKNFEKNFLVSESLGSGPIGSDFLNTKNDLKSDPPVGRSKGRTNEKMLAKKEKPNF